MYYVYLLKSLGSEEYYIGCTSDLRKRLQEYNNGDSYYTKKYSPWKVVYYKAFLAKEDAFEREQSLKLHAQGLRRLKERLRRSLSA